jgi:hypothetical protein
MARRIQCCKRCGKLEEGHTGPADKYICVACHNAGWRTDGFQIYRVDDTHGGPQWKP